VIVLSKNIFLYLAMGKNFLFSYLLCCIFLWVGCENSDKKNTVAKKFSDTLEVKQTFEEDSVLVEAKGIKFKIPPVFFHYKHFSGDAWKIYPQEIKDTLIKTLSEKDYNYIVQQSKKRFLYSPENIPSKISLPENFSTDIFMTSQADEYKKSYNEDGFCYLSAPLFSIDNQYFIVLIGSRCGAKCGNEDIMLYKKINGEYRLEKRLVGIVF
jgi:hypothetical protein